MTLASTPSDITLNPRLQKFCIQIPSHNESSMWKSDILLTNRRSGQVEYLLHSIAANHSKYWTQHFCNVALRMEVRQCGGPGHQTPLLKSSLCGATGKVMFFLFTYIFDPVQKEGLQKQLQL